MATTVATLATVATTVTVLATVATTIAAAAFAAAATATAIIGSAARTTVAAVMTEEDAGVGRLFTADQGDADNRDENRDAQN